VFTYAIGSQPGLGPVFGNLNLPLQGVNPPKAERSPIRYDVPCETQEPPDLRTQPSGPPARANQAPLAANVKALSDARKWEGAAEALLRERKPAAAKGAYAKARAIRQRSNLFGKAFDIVKGRIRVVDAAALEKKRPQDLTRAQAFALKQYRVLQRRQAEAQAQSQTQKQAQGEPAP